MRIMKDNNWFCDLCGTTSKDEGMENVTFEQHLGHHCIEKSQYEHFTQTIHGGASQLRVKLLSWSNNVKEAIIAFVSQTWGPTFNLSGRKRIFAKRYE